MENKTSRDARKALADLSLAVLQDAGDLFLEQLDNDLPAFAELVKVKILERKRSWGG